MKKNSFKLPDSHGFTLVETIVASLLMVIGALVLSTGFIASARMMGAGTNDRHNALTVVSVMNGGVRDGTSDRGKDVTVNFSIEGIDFTYRGILQQYANREDESITFYRIS